MSERSKGPRSLLKGPKVTSSERHRRKKAPSLKNQIRGIERLLKKEGLDARIRKKEQSRLDELRKGAETHRLQELERKYAVRYHKVRFFERVKIERRMKQLKRTLEQAGPSTDAHGELQAKLHQATEDLQYVMHFPKGEKYVSLLRNASSEDAQRVLEAERQRIRAKVKQQLADIAMITQADEGLPQASQQPADPVKPAAVQQGLPASVADEGRAAESDEATLSTPGLAREALQSAQPIHALEKSSQPPLKRRRHEKSSSPGETGAVLKSKGVRSDERGVEPAAIGTFEEDEFFMSSSGTDDDGSEQHPKAASSPGLAGALLCAPGQSIDKEQQAKQAMVSVSPHHNDSRQGVRAPRHVSSAGLATSQQPPGRRPAAGVRKAVKHQGRNSKAGSNREARALSTSKAAPAGKSSTQSAKPVKAVAKSKDAEARPSGQPVRTRAEGGRKRRKKN